MNVKLQNMRRTPVWAVIALYPLAVTIVGGSAPDSWNSAVVTAGPAVEFLSAYWWLLIGAPAVLVILFFLGHALVSVKKFGVQSLLWAIGMLFLGPLIALLYWWFRSDAT